MGAAAASSRIAISPENKGILHVPDISTQSVEKATDLLQRNHDEFHIFFNNRGFHNHSAHYVLSALALGATAPQLQAMFDNQKHTQTPRVLKIEGDVKDLYNENNFLACLSRPEYYDQFIIFFEEQLDSLGIATTIRQYIFSDSPIAREMLPRIFAGRSNIILFVSTARRRDTDIWIGFLHPIIHLGFGIEFEQPAIIAEALAKTAIHPGTICSVLWGIESASKMSQEMPLVELIHRVCQSDIRDAPCWGPGDILVDYPLLRAPPELSAIAACFKVDPDKLEEKTAEMINVNAYFTGAAQRPPKRVKLDFFFIHNVNCSIFMSSILEKPWLTRQEKAILLAWKGRFDILAYAFRGAPHLDINEIIAYQPKAPGGWNAIYERVLNFDDDSHLTKFIRAVANGEGVCRPFEDTGGDQFPIKGEMWLQIAHMALDSMDGETYQSRWVKGAGFAKQWELFCERSCL